MSQVCQITGKKPQVGNNVSHANNKTGRRFFPNLHKLRFFIEEENRYITLRVSSHGLRTINKLGVKKALEKQRRKTKKD